MTGCPNAAEEIRKVAYVLTHYPRLAQTFIDAEIEAVERAGQPVRVFAMNSPDAGERIREGAGERIARTTYLKPAIFAGLAALALFTVRHPVRMARVWIAAIVSAGGSPVRIVRRMSHLAQAALLANCAAKEGIERLHAHFGLAPATIAWFAASMLRTRGLEASFSFTIHGYHDFVELAESRLDIKAAEAAAVICISDYTLSQLYLATDPRHWGKFHVVRCGIDIAAFPYRDPSVIEHIPRLLAVGRLSPEKGFAVLLDALHTLRESGIDATVQIVGDGPERTRLKARISELGLDGFVDLPGELSPGEVRRALAAADLFILPSLSEGLPISLMEAMACGTPVVTTWIAGIPELACNEKTALTVPPANPSELAKAIDRLAADQSLRRSVARNARDLVVASHDVNRSGIEVARLLGTQGR